MVRSNLRARLHSEFGLVRRVGYDNRFGQCLFVDLDLHESGLFEFDFSASWISLSYLNCLMIFLSLGGRNPGLSLTLLLPDLRETGFLLLLAMRGGLLLRISTDRIIFLSSLLAKVGILISSVKLKEGMVSRGALFGILVFSLLLAFFFLSITIS